MTAAPGSDTAAAPAAGHQVAAILRWGGLTGGISRQVHLSDLYRPEGWRAILAEAQADFPATTFPGHWASALEALVGTG